MPAPGPTALDAVVLAGGGGRRLGGVSKADLVVGGRRLLDVVLDATAGARAVVVVAPETVAVPAGVARTLEDPPGGGPVAGIAAGLAALGAGTEWVLVLACDVPGAARVVPTLVAAAGPGVDGVLVVDADGRDQPLLGLYRGSALTEAVDRLPSGPHGARVRDLVDALNLTRVPAPAGVADDIDTWTDATRLGVDRP